MMASNVVHVQVSLDDPKAIAHVMVIRDQAAMIVKDQPWNEEAKLIRRVARSLLKRLRIKRMND